MRHLFLIMFFTTTLYGQVLDLCVNAEEAILINAKTGKILFEKNAHQPAYPASTTKIATALLALHTCRSELDKVIVVERESVASITPQAKKQSNYRSPPYWIETDSTHIGIKKGEELKLLDLLHAMMIASANDASNVIAQGIGNTIPKYMEGINSYLKGIGCKNTHFNNPHGLHHPDHITTAYDLSIMAKEGLKDPHFRKIVSMVRYTFPQTNLELERHLTQTNQLLKKGPFYYPKAIGIKTGFTQTSGKNLVAAAQEGDRTLIAVALGYKGSRNELYQDVTKMFDTAFQEPKMRRIVLPVGQQRMTALISGAKGRLKTYLSENLYYEFYASEEEPVKVIVAWDNPSLPITQGSPVGKVKVIDNQGNLLNQTPLFALNELKPTFTFFFAHFCKEHLKWKYAFIALLGTTVLIFVYRKFFKKKKVGSKKIGQRYSSRL